jgi:hypothetical protein
VYGIDFSEYSKQEFLFTPYSYQSAYEPIGLVEIVLRAGMKHGTLPKSYVKMGMSNQTYEKKSEKGWMITEPIDMKEALGFAYEKAVKMGADAICDLKFESFNDRIFDGQEYFSCPTIKIHGFAIKRK